MFPRRLSSQFFPARLLRWVNIPEKHVSDSDRCFSTTGNVLVNIFQSAPRILRKLLHDC